MLKTDWYFIIPATSVYISSLLVTAWDFLQLQKAVYNLGVINVAGLALFVIGVLLRVLSKRTLAKNYTYILHTAEHRKELVKRGVYRFIRHPIYLAAVLYIMGAPMIFSSVYGFLVTLAFIPCILYRIRIEEEVLIQEFGNAYREYKKNTKKLIPYVY